MLHTLRSLLSAPKAFIDMNGSKEPRHLLVQLLPLHTRNSRLTGGDKACTLYVNENKIAIECAASAHEARMEPKWQMQSL
jgi:hypothetical protein